MRYTEFVIDKTSPQPIIQQIFDNISQMIFCGQLSPGEKLPPERELAQKLGISRGTIKRAYFRLAQANMIEIRQGSGSYVLASGNALETNRKKEAGEIVEEAVTKLQAMGIPDREIHALVNLRLSAAAGVHKINIMVLSNNHEILGELEKQLSYLSSGSLFFFTLSYLTLENIQKNPDPLHMLVNYDLIIVTSIDYEATTRMVPELRHKIIEATITPCTGTIVEIAALPRNVGINVLYRTGTFLRMVTKTLASLGFSQEYIFPWHENAYTPANHFIKGVRAVINFNESPVYVDESFKEANEKFVREGGRLIYFEYRIDRSSLLYIEDRIQRLFTGEPTPWSARETALHWRG